MKIYTYYLADGVFPLDWEVCFSTVEEYKIKLFEKYTSSQEYNDFVIGGFHVLTDKIDAILNYALEDFRKEFPHNYELRCPAMIFPLPRGDESNGAEFAIILKRDNDGDTIVYSPLPLSYLEKS
ncbi:hypothetical protein [Paenibacillus polymyxa]|uniref:hypothetical protein n=1 Tax=Paenibacillus polymyxa TaxID=1406 RepID=UPI000F86FC1C|nr:hypothetical protein [Paenibacillus polymyxa]QDA28419.1 hypothetical protein FGY93_16545 [Paenibacillus polymyxa]RTZ37020.1 hypothetical protein EJ573_03675 [Paenibacillus polymyxa]URJ34979.1 hypothetical protein MF625_004297 [Paenibacillus polymyxa]